MILRFFTRTDEYRKRFSRINLALFDVQMCGTATGIKATKRRSKLRDFLFYFDTVSKKIKQLDHRCKRWVPGL
jgi:hypothetical protein